MAFQVSPGVSTAEIDLTTRVPIPSLSQGAMCMISKWGPIHEIVTVSYPVNYKFVGKSLSGACRGGTLCGHPPPGLPYCPTWDAHLYGLMACLWYRCKSSVTLRGPNNVVKGFTTLEFRLAPCRDAFSVPKTC